MAALSAGRRVSEWAGRLALYGLIGVVVQTLVAWALVYANSNMSSNDDLAWGVFKTPSGVLSLVRRRGPGHEMYWGRHQHWPLDSAEPLAEWQARRVHDIWHPRFAEVPGWGPLASPDPLNNDGDPQGNPWGGVQAGFGWPMLSVYATMVPGPTIPGPLMVERGLPAPWRPGMALPVVPMLPGTVVNSVVFGAGVFSLVVGLRAARRSVRRARGACPACGYDLRHGFLAGCPECGWNRAGAARGTEAGAGTSVETIA